MRLFCCFIKRMLLLLISNTGQAGNFLTMIEKLKMIGFLFSLKTITKEFSKLFSTNFVICSKQFTIFHEQSSNQSSVQTMCCIFIIVFPF